MEPTVAEIIFWIVALIGGIIFAIWFFNRQPDYVDIEEWK